MTSHPEVGTHKRMKTRIDRLVDAEVEARLAAMPEPTPPLEDREPLTNAERRDEVKSAAKRLEEEQTATIEAIRAKRAAGAPTPRQQAQAESDAPVAAVIKQRQANKKSAEEDGDINHRRRNHTERLQNGPATPPATVAPPSGISPFRQRSFDEAAQKASAAAEQRKQRAIDIENTLRDHRAQR